MDELLADPAVRDIRIATAWLLADPGTDSRMPPACARLGDRFHLHLLRPAARSGTYLVSQREEGAYCYFLPNASPGDAWVPVPAGKVAALPPGTILRMPIPLGNGAELAARLPDPGAAAGSTRGCARGTGWVRDHAPPILPGPAQSRP